MTEKVSLIVPCFNHAPTLERAVASGLSQSALHEIIIVDDASSDHSRAIALSLAEADPRVHLLAMDSNQGPAAARNQGVRAASARYVAFLDADDELIRDFFQDSLEMIKSHPKMHAVKTEEEFYDPVKGYILPITDPRHQSAVISSIHGLVIEKEAFQKLGGFPEDDLFRGPCGGEDVAFMQAVISHLDPIGRIAHPCYRVWSQSGSHVDKFLANTRLTKTGFEFVHLHPDQEAGGILANGMRQYLISVDALWNGSHDQSGVKA